MASKYSGLNVPKNFSDVSIDIDAMCDAMVAIQLEHGKEPTAEVAYRDELTGAKFRRFQERSEEEEEAFQSAKAHGNRQTFVPEKEDDQQTPRKPSEPCPISRFKTGTFEIMMDGEDEDGGLYICEYCNSLGYRNKFIASVCDNCDNCVECSQRLHDECSGCSYSRHRTGTPYSQQISESELISSDDLDKLKEIEEDRVPEEKRVWNTHFSLKGL